jgi:hypothetical protein
LSTTEHPMQNKINNFPQKNHISVGKNIKNLYN